MPSVRRGLGKMPALSTIYPRKRMNALKKMHFRRLRVWPNLCRRRRTLMTTSKCSSSDPLL